MSIKTINLTENLYDYLLSHSLREPLVLQELRKKTANMHGFTMQISPEQGQFMGLLIQLMGAKKTIDIGTFTGYSSLSVALALPEDGQIITCDIDPNATNVAKEFWEQAGCLKKIQLYLQPAIQTLDNLLENGQQEQFDFIFIDADKRNYLAYYQKAIQLLRVGGLVMLDNVLWSGLVAEENYQDVQTSSIRELNDFIYQDQRVSISMLPLGDGVTLARKRMA